MRRPVAFMLVLAACAPRGTATVPAPSGAPIVLLVSIDGFRADYLDRGATPVLDSLAHAGVRARWMEPSFPSKTFPNHYTIVTGLRPDHHGIIANNITDSLLGRFTMSNRAAVRDPRWWGGEPIWVTAERQSVPTGPMFWPGSEAPIEGIHPNHWLAFDGDMPSAARVDTVLSWLGLPEGERPRFLTLYFDIVDHAGHTFGPDAPQVTDSLRAVDQAMRRLSDGLHRMGIADRVNLVVVSDHGMTAVGPDRVIALDDYIDMDDVTVNDWGPAVMLAPKPGRAEAVYRALKGASANLDVYWKGEVPARLAFGTNPRIPAIVAIAHEGWTVTTRARAASVRSGGTHGYDNALPSMRALFVASGPAFHRGVVVAPFGNIQVYDLLARLLGVTPAPNDGSPDSTAMLLR